MTGQITVYDLCLKEGHHGLDLITIGVRLAKGRIAVDADEAERLYLQAGLFVHLTHNRLGRRFP
jgi:hypothetical protein